MKREDESWLSRPASVSEQGESKPPGGQVGTCSRALWMITAWFRHGPLLRRSPAQPACGRNDPNTDHSSVAAQLNQLQEDHTPIRSPPPCMKREDESWLSRPASVSEQGESKPPGGQVGTCSRALWMITAWFRHGPLLRRGPAQPAWGCAASRWTFFTPQAVGRCCPAG